MQIKELLRNTEDAAKRREQINVQTAVASSVREVQKSAEAEQRITLEQVRDCYVITM